MDRRCPLPVLMLVLGLAAAAHAQPPSVALGNEFRVNTYTPGTQAAPAIAVNSQGNFVVVWQSNAGENGDAYGYGIQGQRFNSNGEPLGDQFLVNSDTTNDQAQPAVAMTDAGNFVVLWQDDLGFGKDIAARRFNSVGDPVGNDFVVHRATGSTLSRPSVVMDETGSFIAVFDGNSFGGGVDEIIAQPVPAGGTPIGTQFIVNSYITGLQISPSIARDGLGDFVVAWASIGSDNGDPDYNIQARRFTSDGKPIGEQFLVNSYTTSFQRQPSVAMNDDGAFVVVWQSTGSDNGDPLVTSIQGQRYDSDGTAQGAQFLVNSYTTSAQGEASVAIDADGDFIVAWQSSGSENGDSLASSIQAQRFLSDGTKAGAEFLVNTYTTSYQRHPVAAMSAAGNFIVAWESDQSADDTDKSIQGQRYRVTADVGNFVFLDEDFDGRQDPDEPGLANVTVHLRNGLGDLVASTLTDSHGAFLFQQKVDQAKTFYVEMEAPAFTAFTTANSGDDDTIDSDVDPASGETANFELDPVTDRLDIDAGLIADIAVIGDRIWIDDGDGEQQVNEEGYPGVIVRLFDENDNEVRLVQTNVDGFFAFANVLTGTYTLRVDLPPGAEFANQDAGSDDTVDSDIDPLTGRTAPFVYTAGTIRRDLDAAIVIPTLFADGFESGDTSVWSSMVP